LAREEGATLDAFAGIVNNIQPISVGV
jgi:hypothetical protein